MEAPLGGLLIQADNVSRRIAESCRDLRCVRTNRLRYLAAIFDDLVECCRNAVNDNVYENAGFRRSSLKCPSADMRWLSTVAGERSLTRRSRSSGALFSL